MPYNCNISDFLDIERARYRWEIRSDRLVRESEYAFAQGARGDVFRGHLLDSHGYQQVAVKVFRGTVKDTLNVQKRLVRELAVWSQLNHPNVATFHGISFGFGPMPGIISPFIKDDLLMYTSRHPEKKSRLIYEIALGLEYLHRSYVIHGDLKPDNVRVSSSGTAKIIDFGMGKIDTVRGFTTTFDPNPRYMAPELFPSDSDMYIRPTFQSDIFSFGMLMLQVLHGLDINEHQWDRSVPYNEVGYSGLPALCDRIKRGHRPRRERYRNITEHQWAFLQRCWHQVAAERPRASDVIIQVAQCQQF